MIGVSQVAGFTRRRRAVRLRGFAGATRELRLPEKSLRCGAPLLLLLPLLAAQPALADPEDFEEPREVAPPGLVEDPIGVPLRVRDYTFPSYAVLHFAPQPATPLGRGQFGVELIASRVNDFQVSPAVEDYLRAAHAGRRRPLDAADAEFIIALPDGEGYYIDGELGFYELGFWYGVSDRVDVGLAIGYTDFGGGDLDGTIFDFHDRFGFGQQGRDVVADDGFQIVIGENGHTLVHQDGPPESGLSDPSLFVPWALPGQPAGWRFNLSGGVKVATTDGFRSSGSSDVGINLTADRRWQRSAVIVNMSAVDPGRFDLTGFDPSVVTSLDVAWIRRVRRWPGTRTFVQALIAEHVLAGATDSGRSEPELQLTAGLKWNTRLGVLGFGLTENLLNYDNTPDIGVHLTWGYLSRAR